MRDGEMSCVVRPPSSVGGDGVQLGSAGGKLIIGVFGSVNAPSTFTSGVFTSGLTTVAFCGVWKDVGIGEAVAVVFRSG